MNRPFLKAGLIGGAALVAINVIGLLPVIGCIALPVALIAYPAIGALAAYWLPPRRESGPAAGQGALAGVISGLIAGLSQVVLTPVGIALSGGTDALIAQVPAELLPQLDQVGIDPAQLFHSGVFSGVSLVCCLPAGLIFGALLGALGGIIVAAVKPE